MLDARKVGTGLSYQGPLCFCPVRSDILMPSVDGLRSQF